MNNFLLIKKKLKFSPKLFIFIIFFGTKLSSIVFLNRYLTPEPLIKNINEEEGLNLSFFSLSASKSHSSDYNYERSDLFNFASVLNLYAIEEGINYTKSQLLETDLVTELPSEWKASDSLIYISMPGKINGIGFSWDIIKEIFNNTYLGWTSGFISNQSAINLDSRSLNSKFNLNFSNFFEILRVYKNLSSYLKINDIFEKRSSILDQNFYINYKFFIDFLAGLKKISCDLKAGLIIPTASDTNVYNPSSVPLGTNGHYGIYGSFELDFLLKEDLSLGFLTRIYNLFSKDKLYRISSQNENPLYGSILENAHVNPGLTSAFSIYLMMEGIREGLGLKFDYSTFNHFSDKIELFNKNLNYNEDYNREYTKWAQEHFGFSIFYDFMRNENEYSFEPFLSFTAKIPVNFFFSHNSTKCFSLALSLEISY